MKPLWRHLKKKALYLSVNVFSTKALIGDTIFKSPIGDGTDWLFIAIFRHNMYIQEIFHQDTKS